VILRLLQGFFVSSEQAGTSTLTMEHSPTRRRAFFVSWINTGTGAGAILSNIAFIPVLALPKQDLLSWGWRIPFLLSCLWVILVLVIRRTLCDSESFIAMKDSGRVERLPLARLFREHRPDLIRVVLCCLMAAPASIVSIYVFGYAVNKIHIPGSELLAVMTVSGVITTATIPLWGLLADRIGRRPVFAGGVILAGILLFPLIGSIGTRNIVLIAIFTFGFQLFLTAGQALQLPIYTEMFPTNVRFSGVAVGTQFGYLMAGFAPTISYAVAKPGANGWIPVWIFGAACCAIAAV
jgi:MFS family permease